MDINLTAATERAIAEASRWGIGEATASIQPPAILLALLSEPECRAALELQDHNITEESIRQRWPDLREVRPSGAALSPSSYRETGSDQLVPRFSPETEAAITIAREWLADLPHPLVHATEHLLMGLAACDHEVGQWLRDQGIAPARLRDEILRQYGMAELPLEAEELPSQPTDGAGKVHLSYPTVTEPFISDLATSFPTDNRPECEPEGSVVRLLDASANRAREALRVIEDYVRFTLDDRHLTERLKVLRHRLASAFPGLSLAGRLTMRDTQADVGTSISTDTEHFRGNSHDVATANFTRLQEALRSLEEFGKIGNLTEHQVVEQIRYDTYTLQKAICGTSEAVRQLKGKRLYVLVDGCSRTDEFEALISSLVEAGVDILQLRDKTLGDRELLDRARCLRELTLDSNTLFVMNDRPDLAALARADGVHVGQEELSIRDVRQIVGSRMLVGVSTHNLDQARRAVLEGASYLGVGPMFPSGTKAFSEFPGLEFARSVAAEIRLPAFAIGGIGLENVDEVLATGIERVAVSGAVVSAESPEHAAQDLLDRLKATR